jgi:hypothetical protein
MKADLCRTFGLVNSRTQRFGKIGKKNEFEKKGSRKKRFKKTEQSDVDETLLVWLQQ